MIPKIIHYCWFGDAQKPKSVLRCINSWKKHCPDFEIREWTEKDFDITQNKYTKQAYEAKAWGFVPDYIRLWIIYNYGGIYLDTDVQVLKDLSPLLVHEAFAGFEDNKFVNFGQGFGAEKGNPVIGAHMKMYDTLSFANPDGSLNKTPSPHYTTACLKRFGLQENFGAIQQLDNFVVYPKDYFCPKDFLSGLVTVTDNTFSIHQFDASWYGEEAQKAKQARWRRERLDFIIHTPNRVLMNFLGRACYQQLKHFLKRGK